MSCREITDTHRDRQVAKVKQTAGKQCHSGVVKSAVVQGGFSLADTHKMEAWRRMGIHFKAQSNCLK